MENLQTSCQDDMNIIEGISDQITMKKIPTVSERIVHTKSILECNLTSITVYLDKAELCRTVPINLSSGQTMELLLNQLSVAIDKDSIRIEAKEAPIVIQDVNFQTNSCECQSSAIDCQKHEIESRKAETMREKESLLAKQNRVIKQRAVLEKFADILVNHDCEKGNEMKESDSDTATKSSKSSFADAFDPKHMETLNGFFLMYESQAEKLDEQILSTNEDLVKIEQILNHCEEQAKELEETIERLKGRELSILIEARENVHLDLNIHYVVNMCSWKPFYDIRMMTSESKMKITYYALIKQNTLEDWNDTKQLIISTVQPPLGGTVPDIGIQKVFFKSSADSKGTPRLQSLQLQIKSPNKKTKSTVHSKYGPNQVMGNTPHTLNHRVEDTVTKEPNSNAIVTSRPNNKAKNKIDVPCIQYCVPRCPNVVASGGEAERVVVGYIDINPTFDYASVPKRAPYAYLKATSVNNSEYVILPGEANVFIDSNYVGKTELKTVAPGEEFTCNLGADHKIKILYNPMSKYRENSTALAKMMSLTFKQMIEVSNNHPRPIKMVLIDQLPVANEDKIKISLQEPIIKHPEKYDKSKAIRITRNSQIEWDIELASGERKEIVLKYIVEYPTGEYLDLISD